MAARRRVAITGLGLVTPVGNEVPSTWKSLLTGKSGGAPISLFDASGFPVRIASEVKGFDPLAAIGDRKLLKLANRSHSFALAAAEQALTDAGIRPTHETGERWGCAVGTGMMGVDFAELTAVHRHSAKSGEIDAARLLDDTSANNPLVFCRSQSTTGVSLIRRGAVDRVLAGGFDSMISPVGIAGFCLLSALSADNETPGRASRPFDITRNGFLLGEGAGFLVLEEWEAARRRGAHVYAELAGDGNSLSSYRITDSPPDGDGPIQSMRQALSDAGATIADVDYINAHGTSTFMNDKSESAAIRVVFGERTKDVSVSSTKSSMGHLIAGAGAVEVAVCALAIRHGELPVNANLREPDPECDLNLVRESERRPVRVAISNSFGFGGSNSCVALRRPQDVDGAGFAA